MTDKRYCVTCNKYVDTLEAIPYDYYDEQKFSCGHTGRRNRLMEENITVTDELYGLCTDHTNGHRRKDVH
jgi:hypothetical protein